MIHDPTEMRPSTGRVQFVSGVLLGLSIGFAAGHVLIFSRSEDNGPLKGNATSSAPWWQPWETASPENESRKPRGDFQFSELEGAAEPGWVRLSNETEEPGLHYFPESMTAGPPQQPSAGNAQLSYSSEDQPEGSLQMTADVNRDPTVAPHALQPVPSAAPIDEHTSQREQQTRRLIQEELPNATPQECDVWCEVLHGLPAEDIRGILQMRKRLGSGSSSALGSDGGLPSTELRIHPGSNRPSAPQPLSPLPDSSDRHKKSIATLRLLHELDSLNLLNRETIAYKSRVPLVAEDVTVESATAEYMPQCGGIRLLGVTRDMSAGELRHTGRPLDVSIDPSATRIAFLQVRRGDDVCYTRTGRLGLDETGRLKLLTAGDPWLIDPPVIIPDEAGEVIIETDGRVQVLPIDGEGAKEAGRIVAVLFFNPAGLRAIGEGLYQATETSGHPVVTALGTATTGQLRQGHVESSNVDEISLRKRLSWQRSMIELLAE